MPTSPEGFKQRIARLRSDIVEQGRRVQAQVERAIEAVFEASAERAGEVVAGDDAIDRVDVAIERAAVALLRDATTEGAALSDEQLRMVLTVVKLNNELERIADSAVAIAEQAAVFRRLNASPPPTFRVMANSVVGILQLTTRAFEALDNAQAQVCLKSDDAALAFEAAVVRALDERIAKGQESVDLGFALHAVVFELDRIADHCTNIAEQVIYVTTGSIVRHQGGRWTDPTPAA